MTDAEKMPGTIGFTTTDGDDKSEGRGPMPCVFHGDDAKKTTAWNQWKYQTPSSKNDEKAPNYLKKHYLNHRSKFEKRYAERHTVWFVGSHDGESAARSTWQHCADYVQGDSHLTIATAAFQYT